MTPLGREELEEIKRAFEYAESRHQTAVAEWASDHVPRLFAHSEHQRAEIEQLKKERDDFHYWAEELAAHGFNVTVRNGRSAHQEFYPLAKKYWETMAEERERLYRDGEPE
jgi:hypothetical protein